MKKIPAIIVIGTSAGGLAAVRSLTSHLPADMAAAVFIVLHIGAHKSEMPRLLARPGLLGAVHPKDGDPIHAGYIYVAPPDHHLIVEPGHMRLNRGPRENWARPAIDPLFRSAARAYGTNVIGIILTGGLSDGTAGLYEICQRGGTTIVQDPAEAVDPSMPRSALAHVKVDYCLPLEQIGPLLVRLVAEMQADALGEERPAGAERSSGKAMTAEYSFHHPVAITCPDCGGALRRIELGSLLQYGCHIGHIYTADVMVAAQFAALEITLAAAMRALSERGELCRQMGEKARISGESVTAASWDVATHEAKDRADVMRRLLQEEWAHPGEADAAGPNATSMAAPGA